MCTKEGSHSGLVRTLGKRVWSNPPRVRISYHPQFLSAVKKLRREESELLHSRKRFERLFLIERSEMEKYLPM